MKNQLSIFGSEDFDITAGRRGGNAESAEAHTKIASSKSGSRRLGAYARNSDPETSHAAANSVDVAAMEAIVLDGIRKHPEGVTSVELTNYLGLPYQTVSPRFRPLCNKGLIEVAGRRENPSGRKALLWKTVATKR